MCVLLHARRFLPPVNDRCQQRFEEEDHDAPFQWTQTCMAPIWAQVCQIPAKASVISSAFVIAS